MRGSAVVALLLCAAACGPAPPTASSPSSPLPSTPASFAQSAPPYAVVLRIGSPNEPYVVQLVSAKGLGGPHLTAMPRSLKQYYFPTTPCPSGAICGISEIAPTNLPVVSISSTRVYVLDGETHVRSLSADGSVRDVMDIDAPPNSQVVFAVSPDDTRIAVAAITLATANVEASFAELMYVEDVGTAANRLDLYSSTTQAEWPVAWHARDLVAGVGPWGIASLDTAYGAVGYRVLDPVTGHTLAELDCATGPLSPAGTACASGFCPRAAGCGSGSIGRQGYDGARTDFRLPSGPPPLILTALGQSEALSPDGTAVAALALHTASAQGANDAVLARDGSWEVLMHAAAPLGWIDDSHLMLAAADRAYVIDTRDPSNVFPLTGLASPATGFPTFAGVVPTNLV